MAGEGALQEAGLVGATPPLQERPLVDGRASNWRHATRESIMGKEALCTGQADAGQADARVDLTRARRPMTVPLDDGDVCVCAYLWAHDCCSAHFRSVAHAKTKMNR